MATTAHTPLQLHNTAGSEGFLQLLQGTTPLLQWIQHPSASNPIKADTSCTTSLLTTPTGVRQLLQLLSTTLLTAGKSLYSPSCRMRRLMRT
jgi:hypothetical protein